MAETFRFEDDMSLPPFGEDFNGGVLEHAEEMLSEAADLDGERHHRYQDIILRRRQRANVRPPPQRRSLVTTWGTALEDTAAEQETNEHAWDDITDRELDGEQISDGRRFWTHFRSRRREVNRPHLLRGFNTDNEWSLRSNTVTPEEIKPSVAFLYSIEPASTGSDVWPDLRDLSKVPARIIPIDLHKTARTKSTTKPRAMKGSWVPPWKMSETLKWPMGQLPSEIYYIITDSLSRDDIKAMRLSCREFEHHISSILFKTVVVPFNTEIYGMLQGTTHRKLDVKGKGKMKAVPSAVGFWKNATAEDIYTGHGIDVFRTFGPRMKRFGMSFEVDEEALANPPLKGSREAHKSYWGEYTWPYPEYQRFEQVSGLEDTADETPMMKFAFSLLDSVQELALSLDSGLGWIAGPDQSLHSRVLRKPASVFGTTSKSKILDRKQQAQHDLWQYIKQRSDLPGGCDLRQAIFHHRETHPVEFENMQLGNILTEFQSSMEMPYINLRQLIDPTDGFVGLGEEYAFDLSPFGMLTVQEDDSSDLDRYDNYPIVPNNLSKMQKEWLLETEWAQRAFLSSYLLAIVDNRFHNVHTINFSRLSSRYLLSLARNDFWNALPNLKSVNLQVIADWRDVVKDNAGFVDTPRITLGIAHTWFNRLLFWMIVPRHITSLNIGWACGGEHAQGLHARNKHLMPAPFLSSDWLSSPENMANTELMLREMLDMRHVEELTLTNCWMPPDALIALVTRHENGNLTKLILDSVSLSAPLTIFNANGNNGNGNNVPAPPPNQNQALQQAAGAMVQAQMQQLWQQATQGAAQQNPQQVNNLQVHHAQLHQQQHQQLQAQHAQHIMAMPHANWAGFVPPQPAVAVQSWIGEHRAGSWPHVIDTISPGATLAIHGCTSCPPNTPCNLKTLEIRSCGYCRLNSSRFDESAIAQPPLPSIGITSWFNKRYQALNKVMMKDKYNWVAEIVQHIPQHEEEALVNGWDMKLGWEDAEEAEGPTFDACMRGGTGRFSGAINSQALPEEED
jgi:hypothetical protein